MPSILNLKFKGNKSFVPFSNLSDADSLTKTWKVCTKVASFLEQGQRLENLSWRLWHLQNLMVDTDNAKSKREFRKLSRCMGDKLDKEKGRSIEELQAPGFRRNHSTDIIQQRALEKEREREASNSGLPGIHRMQFTFSVEAPSEAVGAAPPAQKPDLKPSLEFKDATSKRGRTSTRISAVEEAAASIFASSTGNNDKDKEKDQPLTQRGRKPIAHNEPSTSNDAYSSAALHFPGLFRSDFGPTALLYSTPTLTNGMTYGEGLNTIGANEGFSISRPTIELGLDELLNADSPSGWSSGAGNGALEAYGSAQDIDMKHENSEQDDDDSGYSTSKEQQEDDALPHANGLRRNSHLSCAVEDVVPRTITPSRLGGPSASVLGTKRPALSVRTSSANRTTGPSATPVNGGAQANQNSSAPGGVKAECSNCGATHTPLWRRGLNDELNCNACGLYCKLHKRPRPKSMRNNHGEGRTQSAPRQESQEVVAQCYNCHTTATPLWRKDDEGKTVCNACGLYYKLHGSPRPISMKSDVIRKRARHDARRGSGTVSETPSASPGASRRASPINDGSGPSSGSDSHSPCNYDDQEYTQSSQSELMGALGGQNQQNCQASNESAFSYYSLSYPGPYHPDYIPQLNGVSSDALPFGGDSSDFDCAEERIAKRRRLSNDSASEPPSSATSYSSYSDSYSSPPTSQNSGMDFPFAYPSYSLFRQQTVSYWHPPMLPPDANGNSNNNGGYMIHPPMLPSSEDSPMDFLHPPMHHDDTEALFATYMHPPMMPPEDSPKMSMGSTQTHPPMLPQDWGNSYDYHDNSMQSY